MDEFKEKAVLPKEVAEKVKEQKDILDSGNFNSISPYLIINRMLKDKTIFTWVKENVVKNQLILINAVLNGYDVV